MVQKVFYSFHYEDDSSRIQQVIQMGAVEGQQILSGQKWEEVERGGKAAVEKWIIDQMKGKKCLVVLVGSKTSERPWVKYEIKKAWTDGLGVVGVRVHALKDLQTQKTSSRGGDPFANLTLDGKSLSNTVTLYDPPGADSKAVYASINANIEKLVEDAIKLRAKY